MKPSKTRDDLPSFYTTKSVKTNRVISKCFLIIAQRSIQPGSNHDNRFLWTKHVGAYPAIGLKSKGAIHALTHLSRFKHANFVPSEAGLQECGQRHPCTRPSPGG